ncbi:MAG: HD domain-containing protein [Leptospirales bacterium]|nr:HD domain-containing protein [Leptospirales bacterium]
MAALSLATDLANDNPPETTLRICYIALETAGEVGLPSRDIADLYYGALLRFIGCTAYAHEESLVLGDDLAARHSLAGVDVTRPSELLGAAIKGSKGKSKAAVLWNFLTQSGSMFARFTSANCEVACMLGARIGMPDGVLRVLSEVHERWDGRGGPNRLKGDSLSSAGRILHVANAAEIIRQAAGVDAACEVIKERSGGQFDPVVSQAFLRIAPDLLRNLESISVWDEVIKRSPRNESSPGQARLREIAEAFGAFVDLKSIYTGGKSLAVSKLVSRAASLMGLNDVEDIVIASLLADVGMVSVPTNILEKTSKLNVTEWERIRLHTYYTERILSRSPILSNVARIAPWHQERLDGSGYHRGASAGSIPMGARLIAAADVYQSLIARRAYRNAFSPDEAVAILAKEVSSGRLDRVSADAVLEAAGKRQAEGGKSTERGMGEGTGSPSSLLSPREMEVLNLLARGHSNKEIGAELDISHRTVQHHVEHIYNKLAVSTRAAATLYAAQNGILT